VVEPARRKRFQIHLSTAVVMTIVAGVLIWLNIPHRPDPQMPDYYACGCPLRCAYFSRNIGGIIYFCMFANIGIGLGILLIVWHYFERRIERLKESTLETS